MALDKDILGNDLYNRAAAQNDVEIAPEDLEAARLEFWKGVADIIITHFKENGELNVPGYGLMAGTTPVSGTSTTGKIS